MTGATGYVGGQLIGELLRRGWAVRAFCRSADKAATMDWRPALTPTGNSAGPGEVELCVGDARDADDISRALEGVDTAWYLLHSMGTAANFMEQEVAIADQFGDAAKRQGVQRIVYLGGLHPVDDQLSDHLRSRVQVGNALMESGVPVAALQAGVVVGYGSASYDMIRHLAERLPLAIAPKWIKNEITPISVRDVVFYLASAADLPAEVSRTFDIGGPENLPYSAMLQRYAEATGRSKLPVFTAPVTTPELASHWISLVAPTPRPLARPLVESLMHNTVVKERDLEKLVGLPEAGQDSFDDALKDTIAKQPPSHWIPTLAGVGAAVLATSVFGSVYSNPNSDWYKSLSKPSWMPPKAVFPIVWTLLYLDIAVMEALVIADSPRVGNVKRKNCAALAGNLILNGLWPKLFFGDRKQLSATVWAAALAVSSADVVRRAWASSPQRGILLVPYLAWTTFATAISGAVALKNRNRQ